MKFSVKKTGCMWSVRQDGKPTGDLFCQKQAAVEMAKMYGVMAWLDAEIDKVNAQKEAEIRLLKDRAKLNIPLRFRASGPEFISPYSGEARQRYSGHLAITAFQKLETDGGYYSNAIE